MDDEFFVPALVTMTNSCSQPTVHQALTCPQGPVCLGRGPSRVGEGSSLNAQKLIKVLRSDLLPLEIQWSCICAGKEMCYTQFECVVRNPGCFCFGRVCLVWLLWCCGGSTVDKLREDESRIVVLPPRKQSHREIDRNVFPSP